MNTLQTPEVFYYPSILLLNSSERAAYIVFQATYIQNPRKATETSYSFALKLLYLPIKIIWRTPAEETFPFAEEGGQEEGSTE